MPSWSWRRTKARTLYEADCAVTDVEPEAGVAQDLPLHALRLATVALVE